MAIGQAAGATVTNYDAVIRALWPEQRVQNLAFEGSAFFAMVPKKTDFYEKKRHVALRYGNPQGRSATFSSAQTTATSAYTLSVDWEMTRISDYAVGTVDGETLETTRHNKAALLSAIETETRGALEELSNTLAFDLWQEQDGVRGTIGSLTGTTIILSTSTDAINFEVGMWIVAAASKAAAVRDSGTALKVTKVDYDSFTLTLSATVGTISGMASGDVLFARGDAHNAVSYKKVAGVPGWIPDADQTITTTAWFGVDRTAHTTRLAGHRYDGSSEGTIVEALKTLAARIAHRGGRRAKPKVVFMNPLDLDNLDIELIAKRDYGKIDVPKADVGFDTIRISTPMGKMDCVGDQHTPKGHAWMLDMRTWCFGSVDQVPRIIQHDGLRMQRQSQYDGVEFRAVYRGNLWCDAPGWNGTVKLPT